MEYVHMKDNISMDVTEVWRVRSCCTNVPCGGTNLVLCCQCYCIAVLTEYIMQHIRYTTLSVLMKLNIAQTGPLIFNANIALLNTILEGNIKTSK